jgi:hypothetical protein
MAVSKGSWESIEVSTRYYELLEEEIKEWRKRLLLD